MPRARHSKDEASGWRRLGLWWVPLLFALVFAGVGGLSYLALERSSRASLESELQTLLRADVEAITLWIEAQKNIARALASDASLREPVRELIEIASRGGGDLADALDSATAAAELRDAMAPVAAQLGYENFVVLDRSALVLVGGARSAVGRRLPVDADQLEAVLAGEAIMARQLRDLTGRGGDAPLAETVFHAAAPIRAANGEVIAALAFRIPADGDFSTILTVARMGASGETYAFDVQGRMLSMSRFQDQLVELGLLSAREAERVDSAIEVRDPGGNLLEGHTPELPLRARPLTRMAADAVVGNSGSDVMGYPDYRGVPVIGAWTWIPNLDLGIATEIDRAEAYAGLATLRRVFLGLAAMLALTALGMALYSLVLRRVQQRFEKARRLGRYEIAEKIGEGGMGKVYRARHSLLRRPTALKLLESSDANAETLARFEREVQAASSLTHPNTIAIYDYGHTPDGTFYYAMEYLDGVTLGQLASADGPQAEARVLHIMRQAASSLAEAHAVGLVHRDLKPSNVMLCVRGGLFDFVKVLDFGLVRSGPQIDDLSVTQVGALTGTPLYMSPEALEAPDNVDARSDIYQLGAVAYYLLTGQHVFRGQTLVEVLSQHLHETPTPPSAVLGREIMPALEKLILACLAKPQAERPADGAALVEALEACGAGLTWSQREAGQWWEEWRRDRALMGDDDGSSSGSLSSLPSGWDVDLSGRSGSRSR